MARADDRGCDERDEERKKAARPHREQSPVCASVPERLGNRVRRLHGARPRDVGTRAPTTSLTPRRRLNLLQRRVRTDPAGTAFQVVSACRDDEHAARQRLPSWQLLQRSEGCGHRGTLRGSHSCRRKRTAGRYGALRIRCVTWADPLNARMVATPRATEIRTSTQLRVALGKRLSVI